MQEMSRTLKEATRGSYQVPMAKIEIINSDGSPGGEILDVLDCSVNVSGSRNILRNAKVSLDNKDGKYTPDPLLYERNTLWYNKRMKILQGFKTGYRKNLWADYQPTRIGPLKISSYDYYMRVEKDRTYKVTFSAKSPSSSRLRLVDSGAAGIDDTFRLTPDEKHYERTFTRVEDTGSNAFYFMGYDTEDIIVSDIKVVDANDPGIEYLPQGVFNINSINPEIDPDGTTLEVEGQDVIENLIEDQFDDIYKVDNKDYLEFDGVDDRVVISDNSVNSFNTETTWAIKIKSPQIPKNQILMTNGGNYLRLYSSRLYVSLYTTSGQSHQPGGVTVLENDKWYHLAFTYDGKTLKAYVNGVLDYENVVNLPLAEGSNFLAFIGDFSSGTAYRAKGILQDAVVYNRALNSEEIKELAGGVIRREGLLNHYPMKINTGTVVKDNGPNPRDGAITGATWKSVFESPNLALASQGGSAAASSSVSAGDEIQDQALVHYAETFATVNGLKQRVINESDSPTELMIDKKRWTDGDITPLDGDFEICSGKLYGDPNLSNGQSTIDFGGGWTAALHHSPVDEYIEIMTDGGRTGKKYARIYDNGSGQWKAVKASPNVNFSNFRGKWMRASVWVRHSNGKTVAAYLMYDSGGPLSNRAEKATGDNDWYRLEQRVFVPSDYSVVPNVYLYGHFGGVGFTDFDGYKLEGPFDHDPGPSEETDWNFKYTTEADVTVTEIESEIFLDLQDPLSLQEINLNLSYGAELTDYVYLSPDNSTWESFTSTSISPSSDVRFIRFKVRKRSANSVGVWKLGVDEIQIKTAKNFTPNLAVDGDIYNTDWRPKATDPDPVITFDLGAAKNINVIYTYWSKNSFDFFNRVNYFIETSVDGSAWTRLQDLNGYDESSSFYGEVEHVFNEISARYVRINIKGRDGIAILRHIRIMQIVSPRTIRDMMMELLLTTNLKEYEIPYTRRYVERKMAEIGDEKESFLRSLATSANWEAGTDENGVYKAYYRDIDPVRFAWEFNTDTDNIFSFSVNHTNEIKNVIVVTYETSEEKAISGRAIDDNPLSPTSTRSLGRRVVKYSGESYNSQEICDRVSQERLFEKTRQKHRTSIPVTGHPGIQVDDVVVVTVEDAKIKDARYLVTGFESSFRSESAEYDTRINISLL
jgi:hypothetical protein